MRIDVHAHLWTDEYLDLVEAYGQNASVHRGLGAGGSAAELDARFRLMDSAGVDRQVLSVSPRVPHLVDEREAVQAARLANDTYAEFTAHYPERFSAFAALPLPHLDAALTELARALDDLGMLGAAVTTDVLGKSLADPVLTPLWEELDRRGTVLYVHPAGESARTPLIAEHHMTWMVGAPVEDTIAVTQLLLAGIPSRYPNVKIIISHLGGALPMLLQRIDNQSVWEAPGAPEKPSDAARRLWYDTVGHTHLPAVRAAAETFGADRLVLGTDFPYEDGDLFRRAVSYVGEGLGSAGADVLDRNAARLLGF
ncbi:amidohydrolase [Actinoplanes sp. TBRC 11911]|uniref:amidohydrolase family protein n=1 Tax=Actinoplanes sp. TBRC 11911 TaxID=2729386 RepID=UPI00145E0C13|nr:amidohydrolase family protein [Actinoplanes sp. TBRC 11911]NMO51481.1 amidohydrolase [Actinoplanes sp. TBRC 11911]